MRWEGFRERAYLDLAGVPTIGWGFTRYLDGRLVRLGDPPISRTTADMTLRILMTRCIVKVVSLCPKIDTPARLAAIGDFTYNLGVAHLSASTLRRRINAGNWFDVPRQLRKWTHAGSRQVAGLIARREAEIQLI